MDHLWMQRWWKRWVQGRRETEELALNLPRQTGHSLEVEVDKLLYFALRSFSGGFGQGGFGGREKTRWGVSELVESLLFEVSH